MNVTKRDGSNQRFESHKINVACMAAGASEEISTLVANGVMRNVSGQEGITVEELHKLVEGALMLHDQDTARRYIEYRSQRDRDRVGKPDPEALGNYIHASKYAKHTGERRETYLETVDRVCAMHCERWPSLADDIYDAFDFVREKRVLPSMRSMQFGGEAALAHNARMFNCSFTLADRPEVFGEVFYLLLAGCGVGYSVQFQHVAKLPALQVRDTTKVCHHHIEDSIEGWADAVTRLFDSFVQGYFVQFDYSAIRPEGSPLRTSGGKAPGHVPLYRCLAALEALWSTVGDLRPVHVHDSLCHIAEAVLAGGIRRSSLIALFSADDGEMMRAKAPENFEWTGKNKHRAMANNSAVFLRGSLGPAFRRVFDMGVANFEPGFFLTNDLDWGTNPCGEIGLDPVDDNGHTGFAFCNLCEVNVAVCKTNDEFLDACAAATFIGTMQAAYTDFKYIKHNTADRDALLGVGLTGISDNPSIGLNPELLREGALTCRWVNMKCCERLGVRVAKRITCVKPSGTASLELGGVGSGIHPQHAKRFFRRVTANKNEPVAQAFAKANPHMVQEKSAADWSIVFPCQCPDDSVTLADVSGREFIEQVMLVYDNWILPGCPDDSLLTHNVSATTALDPGEDCFDAIDVDRVAAMSFCTKGDDRLPFMPRMAVRTEEDEALWRHLIRDYVPVDYESLEEVVDGTARGLTLACSGGTCEIEEGVLATSCDGGKLAFGEVPEGWRVERKEMGGLWIVEIQPRASMRR